MASFKVKCFAKLIDLTIKKGDLAKAYGLIKSATYFVEVDADVDLLKAKKAEIDLAKFWAESVSSSVAADYAAGNVQGIG